MIALAYIFACLAAALGVLGISAGALLIFAWFYDRWLCRAAHRRQNWTYGRGGQIRRGDETAPKAFFESTRRHRRLLP